MSTLKSEMCKLPTIDVVLKANNERLLVPRITFMFAVAFASAEEGEAPSTLGLKQICDRVFFLDG